MRGPDLKLLKNTGFKLFDIFPIKFPVDEQLVMVIGSNGTGKSYMLEAMRDYFIKKGENVVYFPPHRILDITYQDAQKALAALDSLAIMSTLSEAHYDLNLFGKWGLKLDMMEFDMKMYYGNYIGSGFVQLVNFLTKIINAGPDTIVLIDTPETSIHYGIRRNFIDDLLHLGNIKKLIAVTHQPEILSNHWEETWEIERIVDIGKPPSPDKEEFKTSYL